MYADHSNSNPHVIPCIRSKQFGVQLKQTRVIVYVQCSGGRSSCLPRILAAVCHAAVVISQQNVDVGKHHILVDRTAHEKAACEASLRMPLISSAARISTAVMLAPRLASRHSSIP